LVRRKQRRNTGLPGPPAPAFAAATSRGRWQAWLPLAVVLLLLGLVYPEAMFEGRVYGGADTAAAESFRQVGDQERQQGRYPLWNPYIFGGMPTFGSLAYTHGVYPPTLLFEFLQGLGLPPLTWMLGHLLCGGLGMWWLLGRLGVAWPGRLLGTVAWLWSARLVAWAVHGHGSKLGAEMYLPWLVGLVWLILTTGGLRPVAMAALLLGLQFLRGHVQISYYTLLAIGLLTVWHLVWPLAAVRLAAARADIGHAAAGQPPPASPPRQPLRQRWQRAGLVAVAVGLGFAIGAALLLPVHSYAEISTRGAGGATGGDGTAFDYATAWSLAPEDLAAVILPGVAGYGKASYLGRMPFTDNPNYIGLLLLVLAAAAWLARGQRSLFWVLVAGSVVSVLLAMGRFSPGLYQLAYTTLPYFDKFRVPAMIMVLPVLGVAVLAALGVTQLADPRSERATVWLRRLAWGLFGGGGLLLLLGTSGLAQATHREWLQALAAQSGKPAAGVLLDEAWGLHRTFLVRGGLVLLAAGGAFLVAARRPRFRATWLVPVLVLLVAVDQWSVIRLVTHPERALVDVVRGPDGGGRLVPAASLVQRWQGPRAAQLDAGLARALQDAVGHGRLLPLGADAGSNAFMTAGVRSLGGYHPAKPATAEAMRQALYPRDGLPGFRVARWLGAAALTLPQTLSPADLDLLREHGLDLDERAISAGGTMIYRLRDPWPRARLVDRYLLADALPAGDALEPFLDAIAAGRHDPARALVLERTPEPAPQTGPEPLPDPIFVRDGLNEVVLRVETPRPVLLLLADLWAPGWQARSDGRSVPLLRADLMLRAIALPAGTHEVSFEFRDPALRRGVTLALVGVLGVLVLLTAGWFRARSRARAVVARGDNERDR
jgi:hypothetical protein